jgi:hypothetical protein
VVHGVFIQVFAHQISTLSGLHHLAVHVMTPDLLNGLLGVI